MTSEVAWPSPFREQVDSFDLSPDAQVALIDTLNRRAREAVDGRSHFSVEVSLPGNNALEVCDFYVRVSLVSRKGYLVITDATIDSIPRIE